MVPRLHGEGGHGRAATIFALIVTALCLLVGYARAADVVPREAERYRRDLVRNVRLVWGIDAPVATFAGQVHQESGWRHDARSAYAGGLAQFTPDTADWIGGIFPDLAERQPFNPAWALRALARYDRWLWDKMPGASACDRMAFVLSGYNGGAGWTNRDIRAARSAGAAPDRWWGGVERFNAGRADWAFRENRDYPRRILMRWEPLYLRTGWGLGVCHG